jgi:hypothetical protein
MHEYRAKQKVKHSWQDQNEKRIEARFIKLDTDDPAQMAMNQLTFARLYMVSKQIRDIDELDKEERIYSELWKELETQEAILKEIR